MNTATEIVCSCGAKNAAVAFRCHECGTVFDGRAGHTVSGTGRPTIAGSSSPVSIRAPQSASIRVPMVQVVSGNGHVEPTGRNVEVGIITFNSKARVHTPPTSPQNVGGFVLSPKSCTNEAAGLELTEEIWQQHAPNSRLNVILFGDGEPTAGGGLFGGHGKAAVEVARGLKDKGARIATIGFKGPSYSAAHLRELASSPALTWEASAGTVMPAFRQASVTIVSNNWMQGEGELVMFVIDESGSMGEGKKKQEVEEAVAASVQIIT